jgi:peptidoglycan/xylan/chitin deacetylase (PgdA/CDA1 family)
VSGTKVLLYHIVDDVDSSSIAITIHQFREHLAIINDLGYRTLTLDQFITSLSKERGPGKGEVLLTFDDGYADVLTKAAPEVARYGFHATVFLVTGYMGALNWWNRKATYLKPHLTWQQARELLRMGWDLGAHTTEHHSLVKLTAEMAEEEMVASKGVIESETGTVVRGVAYPYGDANAMVEEIAARHFEVAFATGAGDEQGLRPHRIRRVEPSRYWSGPQLRMMLEARSGTGPSLRARFVRRRDELGLPKLGTYLIGAGFERTGRRIKRLVVSR